MRYVWASASHKGMVRENNEDSVFPTSSGESADSAILIVADGMGGHVAGEVASRIAINTAASVDLDPVDRIAAGNRAIREEVARDPCSRGNGDHDDSASDRRRKSDRCTCWRQPGLSTQGPDAVTAHRRSHCCQRIRQSGENQRGGSRQPSTPAHGHSNSRSHSIRGHR